MPELKIFRRMWDFGLSLELGEVPDLKKSCGSSVLRPRGALITIVKDGDREPRLSFARAQGPRVNRTGLGADMGEIFHFTRMMPDWLKTEVEAAISLALADLADDGRS